MSRLQEIEEAEKKGGKVFCGNIRHDTEKDEVEEAFKTFGKIVNIWIAKQPPGFGFVTFWNEADAREAAKQMNGEKTSFSADNGSGLRVEQSTGGKKKTREDSRDRGFRQFKRRSRSRSNHRHRQEENGRDRRKDEGGRDRGRDRRDSRGGGRERGRDRRQ